MIKKIVFDLGGIFLKLNREEACRRFYDLGIKNIEELLDPYLQKGCFLAVENGTMDKEAFAEELSRIAGRSISQAEIMNAYMGFIEEIQAYKFDFVEELAKDYPIYILSNTNPYILDLSESNNFLPNGKKLSDYCIKKFASCEMGLVKPDKEIFLRMINEAGLIPEETLFIDDGAKNISVAKELGFHCLQPKNGEDWRETVQDLLKNLK